MRALIIGATGTIGAAVASEFERSGHEVLRASRKGDIQVDISQPRSIQAMYGGLGKVDAVVCCAGDGVFAPLTKLSDEQIRDTLDNKLMGQVNLVRFGILNVADGGVFVLTSGIFSQKPPPGVPALAMANGALESFARAAALDLPRGIRIGTISPPFITETAQKMGLPTTGTLSAAEAARTYVELAQGKETGVVLFPGS